jgi:esterase/lipase superfamily enzyme
MRTLMITRVRRIAGQALVTPLLCWGLATVASAQSVSMADQLTALAGVKPESDAESELLLKARTEALAQLGTDSQGVDEKTATAFSKSVIDDARKLYRDRQAALLPVLRAAAQVALRFKQGSRAVSLLQEAEAISKASLGPEDPANRFVLAELAQAYQLAGQAQKAKEAKDRADYLGKIAVAAIQGGDTLGNNEVSGADALYQIVPVFFQTTRVKTGRPDPRAFFGGSRDDKSHFGVSYVSVPKDRNIGTVPRPSIFRLNLSADPSRHVILKEIVEVGNQADFWKTIKRRFTSSVRKEALVYIHGFNQSFQNGVETAATLSADLEIDGAVVSFSWPSRNNLLLYAADFDEATAVFNRMALRDLLTQLAAETGAQQVYVVAHSMGNRLLLEAMALMTTAQAKPPIDKLVFASPDMESNDFTLSVGKIEALSKRMTLYTANVDLALKVSDLLRGVVKGAARAGERDGGVKPTKLLDVVDASSARQDVLGHANFVYMARDDLRALVWFGLPAEGRCVLVGQRSDGWRYEPASPCTSDAFSLASLYFRRHVDGAQALSRLSAQSDARSRSASDILKAMLASMK